MRSQYSRVRSRVVSASPSKRTVSNGGCSSNSSR